MNIISTKQLIRHHFSEIALALGSSLDEHNKLGEGYFLIPFETRYIQITYLIERSVVWPKVVVGTKPIEAKWAGFGLIYLIEFLGREEDIKRDLALLNIEDIDNLVFLTNKYALPMLHATDIKFSEFKTFAMNKVRAILPDRFEIRANKWVRPEWISSESEEQE